MHRTAVGMATGVDLGQEAAATDSEAAAVCMVAVATADTVGLAATEAAATAVGAETEAAAVAALD